MSTPFGEFHLLDRIAAGGMAEVYRAEIRGLGGFKREVAIKRILPEHTHDAAFVEMLLDEARIAARLSHPNIAQVQQCGQTDGAYYIVMELVDGVALSRVLGTFDRAGDRLSAQAAVYAGVGLLRGLDHAHKARGDDGNLLGVVHRDVSPHNLLVSVHGDVKLIDFGVAQAEGRLHQSASGVLKGKVAYMAPEQVQGGRVDARTDQYAAALVLAEAVTGRRVYGGRSEIDVIRAVLETERDDIKEMLVEAAVPPAVIGPLARALARDPAARFDDCEAFAAALLAAFPINVEAARAELAAAVQRVRAERRAQAPVADTEVPTRRLTPGARVTQPTTELVTARVSPPASPTTRRAATLGAGVATLVALVAWVVMRTDDAPLDVAPRDAGAVVVDAPPPPSVLDAAPRASPDAGPVAVTPVAPVDAEPVRRKTNARAAPKPTGTLDLQCVPWCEITIDGKGGLRSPLRGHALPVGTHQVEVVNPPSGKRASLVVEIAEGAVVQRGVRLE